jgi:hypothetical protein
VPALTDIAYPADLTQIPDIFIDLFTNTTFGGEERIGYIRLKVKDCLNIKAKPNWFRFASPYNDTEGACAGLLLASV